MQLGAFITPEATQAALEQQGAPKVVPEAEQYWAARTADKVVSELRKKERYFFDFADRNGFTDMWRYVRAKYFGKDQDSDEWVTQVVGTDGPQGEYLVFRIGDVRSFAKQLINMAIGNRPAFESIATNNAYDSRGQAESADTLIGYVYENEYGERKERRAVESAIVFGKGSSWCRWDPNGGEMVDVPAMRPMPDGSMQAGIDPVTGQAMMEKVRSGEIVLKALYPWESFCEPTVADDDDHLWKCVRERRSKWEIAGMFPEHRERILMMNPLDEFAVEQLFAFDKVATNSDEIIVKHFYHAPSSALAGSAFEKGRYICYAGDLPLLDLTLTYPRIPLIDLCPSEFLGTSFGYADVWDLCSVSDMKDQITSDIASNLSTFGRQCISAEDGTDFDADAIVNGYRVLTRRPNTKAPEAVMLAAIPQASMGFLDFLGKSMQQLSSLNSVARGDTDASITSGTMAALYHSIAIENNSGAQVAVDQHREELANLILDILKQNAQHPFTAQIVGSDERPYLQTFNKDSLTGVRGVRVKTANPMMRTQAGRLQIAELLLKVPGAVQDPAQINEIIVSGQMKPLYSAPRKRRLKHEWENERLLEGAEVVLETPQPKPPLPNGMPAPLEQPYEHVPSVPVDWMDNHRMHIDEHYAAGCARDLSEEQRRALMVHREHHMKVWRETDPAKLAAVGLPPYPQPMMPPPPGAPPGAPPGGPMPRVGSPGKPANDNGNPPEAMKPTDQGPRATGEDSTGVPLPEPAKSPIAPGKGAAA